ncbi:MAG TPA: prephenate dehydratase [Candidatus Angelobacter sp.]|nr:prephenate dehydratase [Candidatus Angelobacter sp.]
MKVAIQGERGAFSHQAALELMRRFYTPERATPARTAIPDRAKAARSGSPGSGDPAEVLACATSFQVFEALDRGQAAAAVIPVENTLAGPVGEHLDLLLERDVFIHAELRLRIEHNLIAAPGTRLKDVKKVLSHPVALDQCRNFFRKHRGMAATAFYDTAGSVKHIMAERLRDTAAIASRQAAKEYGAKILQSGLEDEKQNFTRFFLIDKKKKISPRADKTSLVFSLKNVSGALFKALSVFALRDLDLSKIESRPVRGKPWEYRFYVDVLRGDDPPMRLALNHLEEIAGMVKVLGVYPRAK